VTFPPPAVTETDTTINVSAPEFVPSTINDPVSSSVISAQSTYTSINPQAIPLNCKYITANLSYFISIPNHQHHAPPPSTDQSIYMYNQHTPPLKYQHRPNLLVLTCQFHVKFSNKFDWLTPIPKQHPTPPWYKYDPSNITAKFQ
jgi:hypothetical protein